MPLARLAFFMPLLALCACATTAGGLANGHVRESFGSARSAREVATCVAEALIGDNQLRGEGDHYWVLRMNGYGMPVIRWDFTSRPGGGSRAELRASVRINAGTDKVLHCI